MKNGRIYGIFGLLLAASLSAACASGTPEAAAGDRSETGMTERERVERIDAILGEKANRSPAQQKIESRLLYEIKRRSGDPAASAAEGLRSSVMVEPDGTTLIDLKAEVSAKSIIVIGQVIGNLNATERIEIQATGVVEGDVRAPRLNVQEGAVLNGSIDMSALSSSETKKPATPPQPATASSGASAPEALKTA